MHHSVYRLLLKFLVPVLLVAAQAHATAVKQLIITPNSGGHPGWVELIKSAKKEVRLAMYNMSDAGVVQALKDAAANKVDVKVLFDLNNSKKAKQTEMLQGLRDAGVQVALGSPEFTISHEKAMAIDGERLLIATINLTGYPHSTRGYGVVVTCQKAIKEFLAVYDQDWENSKNKTGITPPIGNSDLIWSPNHGGEKLIELINSAQKSVVVEVENLSYEPILNALGDAQEKRGVKVRVITPLCGFGNDPFFSIPALRKLELRGADARVMPSPSTFDQPFIHAKMITVDGKRTYLGSLNFSYNSIQSAREVGIILNDEQAVGTIGGEFEKDWTNAVEVPEDLTKVNCTK